MTNSRCRDAAEFEFAPTGSSQVEEKWCEPSLRYSEHEIWQTSLLKLPGRWRQADSVDSACDDPGFHGA